MAEEKKLALVGIGIEPNQEVILTLKKWLKWAEEGTIHSLVLIGEAPEAVTRKSFAGDYSYPQLIFGLTVTLADAVDEARGEGQQVEIPPDDDDPSA